MAEKKSVQRKPPISGWEEYVADEDRKAAAAVVVRKRVVGLFGIIAAISAIGSYYFRTTMIRNNKDRSPKNAFLQWFVENGGTYHPIGPGDGGATANVTIGEFPSYGGWGLALTVTEAPSDSSNGCRQDDDVQGQCTAAERRERTPVIRHLDPLFTVPSSIIITVQSVIETYASASSPLYLPDFRTKVNAILDRSFPNGPGLASRGMGLGQQDAIIAAFLMAEDCQHRYPGLFENGEDSFWGAYLDVLPQSAIPRLDTFGDEDYAALGDELLERAGRESRRLLGHLFTNDDTADGGDGNGFRTVIRDMIRRKIGPSTPPTTIPDSCISFDAFHRFIGITSSRAMVLKGVKHLTPLAEMVNYSPKVGNALPFDLYHTLLKDNSITVRSDRDVFLPDSSGGATMIQLFEDYGPVDSSLFLSAHAFVPPENPNNCATIAGATFLRRSAAVGRFDENVEQLFQALKALRLIHPEITKFEALDDVCVKGSLEIIDDGNDIGRKPASDSIAMASLILGDSDNTAWDRIEKEYGETFASLRDKCISAIRSGDAERIEIRCARFPESDHIVKEAIQTAARRAINSFADHGDSEENLLLQLQNAETHGRQKLTLALRFRIEERKILNQIVHFKGEVDVSHGKSADDEDQIDPSKSEENIDKKLDAFKLFIETLGLPLNKLEPKLVGNGMRVGAFATEDLKVDDVYIALPANSVIDVNTALADTDSDFKALVKKFSNWSQDNGGFDALLLYLLHERFILKERSRWWPYLDLLPSIKEMSAYHPLFFTEKEIDRYLSGSDVRLSILKYQRHASDRHRALSADLDVNLLLSDVVSDKRKVFWATAILDSRSIWWSGLRHLVPLLDLVNADNNGVAHQTRLVDWDGMESKTAVTAATRQVEKGEQVFENYAQPNHLLFTYHGFLLEENAYDCALVDGLSIHRSTAPTFCVRDLASIEELAQFLRTKYGLSIDSAEGSSVDDDVRPYLIQVLEERIARLTEATDTNIYVDGYALPRLQYMRQIVNNDLIHFRHALEMIREA